MLLTSIIPPINLNQHIAIAVFILEFSAIIELDLFMVIQHSMRCDTHRNEKANPSGTL